MTSPDGLPTQTQARPRYSRRSSLPTDVIAVNLSVGSLHIALISDTEAEKIFLKDYRSIEIDPNVSTDTTKMAALLKKELRPFVRASKNAEIWTTPYLDETNFHNIRIPSVSPSRLPGAVHWALQRKEPFIENETIVDFQVNEGATTKSVIDLSCALSVRSPIESIKQTFTKAGFSLAGIGLPLFSLYNLFRLEEGDRNDAPFLIIEMGFKFTSATVVADRRIVFTRNIPIGLLNLVETLNREFDPSPSKQEALQLILDPKNQDNLSEEIAQQSHLVPSLIQSNLERLIRQVESTIEYYQTNFETLPLHTIFLSGEIAARPHLVKFLSKRLSIEIQAINPFKTLNFHPNSKIPIDEKEQIRLGPACGLAIEARKPAINFSYTYKERKKEKTTRRFSTLLTIVLIIFSVCLTAFYRSNQENLQSLKSAEAKLEFQVSTMGNPITEVLVTNESSQVMELQKQRQEATKRYRGIALLSEISRETPENIAIQNLSALFNSPLSADSKEDSKDPSSKSVSNLQLNGLVSGKRAELETSLTIYVARLEKSPLFKQVKTVETALVNTTNGTGLTFTLNVFMNEQAANKP